jgi:hypothetical protein
MTEQEIRAYAVVGLLVAIKGERERLKTIKNKEKREEILKNIEELDIKYDSLRIVCSPPELKDSLCESIKHKKYKYIK